MYKNIFEDLKALPPGDGQKAIDYDYEETGCYVSYNINGQVVYIHYPIGTVPPQFDKVAHDMGLQDKDWKRKL